MKDNLIDHLYTQGLRAAQDSDLKKACYYLNLVLKVDETHQFSRKLLGLCLFRKGNYEVSFQVISELKEDYLLLRDALTYKKAEFEKINRVVTLQKYKQALKVLGQIKEKSALEYNYEGCLYMILNKKNKARVSFEQALIIDRSNEEAWNYLNHLPISKKKWWFYEFL